MKRPRHSAWTVMVFLGVSLVLSFPALAQYHSADTNTDQQISLSELLRVIQFFNSDGYHCEAGTEDGYAPDSGDTTCSPHDSDYAPQDWQVNLSELLRSIQFFNSGGYHGDCGTEDDFAPGSGTLVDCAAEAVACPADAFFGQQAISTTETMTRVFSSQGTAYRVYDDFSGLSESIGKVEWFGFEDDGGSYGPCDRGANTFYLGFFQDNGGVPGTEIYSETVTATREDTGLVYSFYIGDYPLHRYSATLSTPVTAASGWFTVQSTYEGQECYFLPCNSFSGNSSGLLSSGSSFSSIPFDIAFCFSPAGVKRAG